MKLIIMHMESISMLHIKQFPEIMGKIEDLGISWVTYTNFYSTCTSTIMSLVDIFGEELGICDHIEAWEDIGNISRMGVPHWKQLGIEAGKHVAVFYPQFWNENERSFLNAIFGKVEYWEEQKAFRERLGEIIDMDSYEMLFVYDGSSSLTDLGNRQNTNSNWLAEWKKGFEQIIDTLEYIVESLKKYNKLQETVIMMYGDHGEDFWTHSFNGGYVHCIEPYSNIINVPLYLYYPRMPAKIVDKVFSMSGLNKLIGKIIANELNLKISMTEICDKQGVAFARNMFMNQSEKDKPYRKAYCATDGEYILIETKDGYELYMNAFDISNNGNLFDFFSLKSDGNLQFDLQDKEPVSSHFNYAMSNLRRKEIEKKFYYLKKNIEKEKAKIKEIIEKNTKMYKNTLSYK